MINNKLKAGKVLPVWTPSGKQIGVTRSAVGPGEVLIDKNIDNATVVPFENNKDRIGKDSIPSSIQSEDSNTILGNDYNVIDWARKGFYGEPRTFSEGGRPAAIAMLEINKKYNKVADNMTKYGNRSSISMQTAKFVQEQKDKAVQPYKLQLMQEMQDLKQVHQMLSENRYNCGKVPFFDNGKTNRLLWLKGSGSKYEMAPWSRYTTYGLPILFNGILANYWRKQKPYVSDTYADNPYESNAIRLMAGRHANPYNQIRAMQDVDRLGAYTINNSGGLSLGLRAAARVALNIGLQRNIADVYNQANQLENTYASDLAKYYADLGNQTAARRQSANQYNDSVYRQASERSADNYWKSVAGIAAATQQAYANEFKYKQFMNMMNLYDNGLKMDQAKLNAWIKDALSKNQLSKMLMMNRYGAGTSINGVWYPSVHSQNGDWIGSIV